MTVFYGGRYVSYSAMSRMQDSSRRGTSRKWAGRGSKDGRGPMADFQGTKKSAAPGDLPGPRKDEGAFLVDHRLEDRLFVRVFNVDRVVIGPAWHARGVLSSYWRLYVDDGAGAAVGWAGGRHELEAGRVHLIPAWVQFDCFCDRPVGHTYAHFDVIGLPGVAVRRLFGRPVVLAADAGLELLLGEVQRALKAHGSADPVTVLAAKGLIHLALVRLLEGLAPAERARSMQQLKAPDWLAPVLGQIEARLGEPLGNPELARLGHLSTDHFARRFRAAMGQTPGQFILERRIAAAAQRLVFSADSIKTIAAQTGFANRFYFSRVFARRMGLPPALYRARAGA